MAIIAVPTYINICQSSDAWKIPLTPPNPPKFQGDYTNYGLGASHWDRCSTLARIITTLIPWDISIFTTYLIRFGLMGITNIKWSTIDELQISNDWLTWELQMSNDQPLHHLNSSHKNCKHQTSLDHSKNWHRESHKVTSSIHKSCATSSELTFDSYWVTASSEFNSWNYKTSKLNSYNL